MIYFYLVPIFILVIYVAWAFQGVQFELECQKRRLNSQDSYIDAVFGRIMPGINKMNERIKAIEGEK